MEIGFARSRNGMARLQSINAGRGADPGLAPADLEGGLQTVRWVHTVRSGPLQSAGCTYCSGRENAPSITQVSQLPISWAHARAQRHQMLPRSAAAAASASDKHSTAQHPSPSLEAVKSTGVLQPVQPVSARRSDRQGLWPAHPAERGPRPFVRPEVKLATSRGHQHATQRAQPPP